MLVDSVCTAIQLPIVYGSLYSDPTQDWPGFAK